MNSKTKNTLKHCPALLYQMQTAGCQRKVTYCNLAEHSAIKMPIRSSPCKSTGMLINTRRGSHLYGRKKFNQHKAVKDYHRL